MQEPPPPLPAQLADWPATGCSGPPDPPSPLHVAAPAPTALVPPPAVAHVAGAVYFAGAWWRPAGFWLRAAAFALDYIFLSLITELVLLFSGVARPDAQQLADLLRQVLTEFARSGAPSSQLTLLLEQVRTAMGFAAWFNILVCAAYFSVMHGLAGATLGKAICGLRLLRRDLRPLGLGWAALRYAAYLLSAKLVYTVWLMPFDKERRTLYDYVCGTNVYRKVLTDSDS